MRQIKDFWYVLRVHWIIMGKWMQSSLNQLELRLKTLRDVHWIRICMEMMGHCRLSTLSQTEEGDITDGDNPRKN